MAEIKYDERYGAYMTSNSAPLPFAVSSSQNNWGAFRVFSESLEDDLTLSGLGEGTEQWVQIQLDAAIRIWAFRISCRTTVSAKDAGQVPKNFKIQGSNDGANFTEITICNNCSWTEFTSWNPETNQYNWGDSKKIEVDTAEAFLYYRFSFGESQNISTQKNGIEMTPTSANTVKLTLIDLYQVTGQPDNPDGPDEPGIPTRIELQQYASYQLFAKGPCTWVSSNESVAYVMANGIVVGSGVGTAVITAMYENGNSEECTVVVKPKILDSWDITSTLVKHADGYIEKDEFGMYVYKDNGDISELSQNATALFSLTTINNYRIFLPANNHYRMGILYGWYSVPVDGEIVELEHKIEIDNKENGSSSDEWFELFADGDDSYWTVLLNYWSGEAGQWQSTYETLRVESVTLCSAWLEVIPPTKTEYGAGENFNADGMVVNLIYSDGVTREIQCYDLYGTDLKAGKNLITVQYANLSESFEVFANFPCTVTFVDWDDTVLKVQQVEYGQSADAPETPVREGYIFKEWDQSFNNVTSNFTVRALYLKFYDLLSILDTTNEMNVIRNGRRNDDETDFVSLGKWFLFNGGIPYTIYVNGNNWIGFGSSTEHLKICRRDGATYYVYSQEGILYNDHRFLKIRVDGTTYYNSYTDKYRLIYELFLFDDNSMFLNIVQTPTIASYMGTSSLTCGQNMTMLDIPVNTTPVISFYAEDSGRTWTVDYDYHKFMKTEAYTVSFVDWDGRVISTSTVLAGNGAVAPEPPIREGYTFSGWDSDYSSITENLTVTAIYQINRYTVRFLDWTGVVLSTQLVEYGQEAVAPTPLMREGYTFSGWSLDFANVSGNMDIVALYRLNQYVVVFEDFDGTIIKTQEVEHGSAAVPPADPTRVGYVFESWSAPYDNIVSDTTIMAIYDAVANVTLSPSRMSLVQKEVATLTFLLNPESMIHKDVIWSNSHPEVVTFDESILRVVGIIEGVTTITVTHVKQQVSASCMVTVTKAGSVSDAYKNAIKSNNRGLWDAEITVDDLTVPREDIVRIKVNELEFKESKLGIGSVVSSYVEITLRNRWNAFLNKSLSFKIGMKVEDRIEYVVFGTFYVTDSEGGEDEETVEITAYDSIKKTEKNYTTSLKYPSLVKDVVDEIATQCGLEVSDGVDFPNMQMPNQIKAVTCKEALSVVAQLLGCNVVADRHSRIDFRLFNMTDVEISADSRYYNFKRKDMDSYVKSVKIVNDNGTFLASAASEANKNGLDVSIINPYGTQEIAQRIISKISICYRPGELSFLGDPSLCVGDIITVKDKNGKSFLYPIMENIIEYDGGVKNSTNAYSESEEEQEFTSSKKSEEERLDDIEADLDDLDEIIYGERDPETGEHTGGLVDGLKCVSCTELPLNPDPNTIYLIQGEVTVG